MSRFVDEVLLRNILFADKPENASATCLNILTIPSLSANPSLLPPSIEQELDISGAFFRPGPGFLEDHTIALFEAKNNKILLKYELINLTKQNITFYKNRPSAFTLNYAECVQIDL